MLKAPLALSRFFSLSDIHMAGVRLELTPLNFEDTITVISSIDAASCNLPIHDDQAKINLETVRYLECLSASSLDHGGWMLFKTKSTDICVIQAFNVEYSDNIQIEEQQKNVTKERLDYSFSFRARQNVQYVLDKLITVFTSRDIPEYNIKSAALNHLSNRIALRFSGLLSDSRTEWDCLNAGIKSSAFGDNPTIKSLFSLKQPSVAIMCRCGLKFKKSPNVCTAQTIPGVAFSKVTVCLR